MSTSSTLPPNTIRENIPPEIPSSEIPIGRELGILFGFLFTSLVIMGVYTVIWRAIERRVETQDRARKEKLVAQGVHHGRGGLHEKMLDRGIFMGRAESTDHDDLHSNGNYDINGAGIGIGIGHVYGALDGARDGNGGSRPGSRNQARNREGSQSRIGARGESGSRVQSPQGQMRNFSRNRGEGWRGDDGFGSTAIGNANSGERERVRGAS